MATTHQTLLLLAVGVAGVAHTQAQTAPDAGALRQQIEQNRPPPQGLPVLPAKPAEPAPLSSQKAIVVTVKAFRFAGNTLLSSEQLQGVVSDFLNRPLDYTQLQAAAASVAERYRKAGWVVRAYLPEQDIANGVVTIQIVEAAFGGTKIEGAKPQRVSLEHIQSILSAHQKVGEVLNADELDRALLLAGDLPGVVLSGTLREGAKPGTTDLVLRFTDELPIRGNMSVDNNGSRSTGATRLIADITLNSVLGLGDQISSSVIHTEGSDYVRLGATLPVGLDGWRIGANASTLAYHLVAPEFSALAIKGSSDGGGLEASYPLIRSRLKNLFFNATADHKTYDNQASVGDQSHYDSNTLTLGLAGSLIDKFGGGGSNFGSLAWTSGQLNLGGSPNQATDSATTRTEGHFNKLRYSFSRLQVLNSNWSLYGALSGQWADTNLDSSEKFYLGGASGVRAYPTSEAGGATGQMINLELRRRLAPGLTVSGFYDVGQVNINLNNGFTGAPVKNELLLRGYGLALAWQVNPGVNIKGIWSQRIGDNPNPAVDGKDQDGTLTVDRFWLNASVTF